MAHKQRNDWLDWLQYIALRLVSMILHCFPVEYNIRTAKLIGNIMYAVDRKHRERALGNLRRSFPDMPEETRKIMARRSMQQLCIFFVEMLFTTRLVRIDSWLKYVELHEFRQTLALLMDRRKGLILL